LLRGSAPHLKEFAKDPGALVAAHAALHLATVIELRMLEDVEQASRPAALRIEAAKDHPA
jgi:hypothetical protein